MNDFEQRLQQLYPAESPEPALPPYCELSVAIVLAPTFTITPVAGFLDVLRLAADEADYSRQHACQWTLLGEQPGQVVLSSCGAAMPVWKAYDNPESYDYILVAGGLLPASFALSQSGYDFIARAHEKQVPLIALCVGSFLLARLGLLDGKKCAVGFGHEREMNILFPQVQTYSDRLYLEDDGIITCGGGVSAIDLANEIVAKHCGKARSIKTMRSMLIDNSRKPAEIPGLNYDNAKTFGGWQIRRAIEYMESRLNRPVAIQTLANDIKVNQTTLKQKFKRFLRMTPAQFWQQLRLQHAHHLLLNTDKHLAVIADECGFYDAAHFSKRYKHIYGSTPLQTRKTNYRQLRVRPIQADKASIKHQKITRYYNQDGTEDI